MPDVVAVAATGDGDGDGDGDDGVSAKGAKTATALSPPLRGMAAPTAAKAAAGAVAVWALLCSHGTVGRLLRFKAAAAMGSLLFNTTIILHARERLALGPRETGCMLGYVGVLVGMTQGWLVRVLGRRGFSDAALVAAGTALSAPAMLFWAHTPSPAWVWVTLVPICVARIKDPALDAIITRAAGKNEYGWVLGVASSMEAVAKVAAAAAGGWMLETFGPTIPGTVGAAIMCIAFLLWRADPHESDKRE
jgi:predicted MFS family arabinose efflux permease